MRESQGLGYERWNGRGSSFDCCGSGFGLGCGCGCDSDCEKRCGLCHFCVGSGHGRSGCSLGGRASANENTGSGARGSGSLGNEVDPREDLVIAIRTPSQCDLWTASDVVSDRCSNLNVDGGGVEVFVFEIPEMAKWLQQKRRTRRAGTRLANAPETQPADWAKLVGEAPTSEARAKIHWRGSRVNFQRNPRYAKILCTGVIGLRPLASLQREILRPASWASNRIINLMGSSRSFKMPRCKVYFV